MRPNVRALAVAAIVFAVALVVWSLSAEDIADTKVPAEARPSETPRAPRPADDEGPPTFSQGQPPSQLSRPSAPLLASPSSLPSVAQAPPLTKPAEDEQPAIDWDAGAPDTRGGLTLAATRAVVNAAMPGLRKCWEDSVAYKRTGTRVVAQIRMESVVRHGTVRAARIDEANFDDQPLKRCLEEALTGVEFESPRDGTMVARVPILIRRGTPVAEADAGESR
jgi:hypothetical protein